MTDTDRFKISVLKIGRKSTRKEILMFIKKKKNLESWKIVERSSVSIQSR